MNDPPGGLVLDHGWLRVLGSGNDESHMASLGQINGNTAGAILVAQDVLGGQFAWMAPASGKPTIQYLAPDALRWEDCERGYGDWLAAMLDGGTTGFYETLRWRRRELTDRSRTSSAYLGRPRTAAAASRAASVTGPLGHRRLD